MQVDVYPFASITALLWDINLFDFVFQLKGEGSSLA